MMYVTASPACSVKMKVLNGVCWQRNARNEFTHLRKLQPIGTDLSTFQLNSSFQGLKSFASEYALTYGGYVYLSSHVHTHVDTVISQSKD